MSHKIPQHKTLTRKPSDEQKRHILEYMEKNLRFARGQFSSIDGAKQKQEHWQTLIEELNNIGGYKSLAQWQKFWNDWRGNIRRKASELSILRTQTGAAGDSLEERQLPVLNEEQERLLAIIGKSSFSSDVKEYGVSQVSTQRGSDAIPSTSAEQQETSTVPRIGGAQRRKPETTSHSSSALKPGTSTEESIYSPSRSSMEGRVHLRPVSRRGLSYSSTEGFYPSASSWESKGTRTTKESRRKLAAEQTSTRAVQLVSIEERRLEAEKVYQATMIGLEKRRQESEAAFRETVVDQLSAINKSLQEMNEHFRELL